MIRASFLLIVFCLLWTTSSVGQTYYAGWKYQIELQQVPNGHIKIVYSKRMISPVSSEAETPGPDFRTARHTGMNAGHLVMPAYSTGRNYPVNRDYFNYLNKHIPPVITLPETTFKKGFPDPSKNQYYPKPDGN